MIIGHEFQLTPGARLPQDNGYILLGALSAKFPFLHGRKDIQIAPVRGTRNEDNSIRLDGSSFLHIRGLNENEVKEISGSWIFLNGTVVGLGKVSPVRAIPHSKLVSRQVIFPIVKGDLTSPEIQFETALKRNLPDTVSVERIGNRKMFHIKGIQMIGFPVVLTGLDSVTSLAIQQNGIGKHTSMGCGVFYPRA